MERQERVGSDNRPMSAIKRNSEPVDFAMHVEDLESNSDVIIYSSDVTQSLKSMDLRDLPKHLARNRGRSGPAALPVERAKTEEKYDEGISIVAGNQRDGSEPRKDQQFRSDLLHVAVVDIYCNLKKQISRYSKQGQDPMNLYA